MPSLPFLKLPAVVQREVLGKCNEHEIILASFCSQSFRKLVRSANIPLRFLDFDYTENEMTVKFYDYRFPILVLEPTAPKTVKLDEPELETVEIVGFGGTTVHLAASKSVIFVPWQQSFIQTCDQVIDYIMDLFSQVKPVADVSTSVGNVMRIPFDKWNVNDVDVFQEENEAPMNEQQLKFLLEDLKLGDKGELYLFDDVVGVSEYSTGLRHHSIKCHHGKWLHLDAIMNSESNTIEIGIMNLPQTDQLNTLLKDWISMKRMKNLETFSLSFGRWMSVDEVMRGIKFDGRRPMTDVDGWDYSLRRSDSSEARVCVYPGHLGVYVETMTEEDFQEEDAAEDSD